MISRQKLSKQLPRATTSPPSRRAYYQYIDFGPIHLAAQAITGVEVRDPTADKRISEFCFSIPPEQYLVGGHSRSLARRAMRDRLPRPTLQRYTRGLQGADWYLPSPDTSQPCTPRFDSSASRLQPSTPSTYHECNLYLELANLRL